MSTALMTVEEFVRLVPNDDGQDHELLEGEHLSRPWEPSGRSRLRHRLHRVIDGHVPKGYEALMRVGYVLSDHTFLGPDVSVMKPEQVHNTRPDEWVRGAPALAVRIVAGSDTAIEIERKVKAYFRYGAQEVWVVYPEDRQIHVHEPAGLTHRYEDSVRSTVRSTVLPNLTLTLDELFRGLF